MFRQSVIFNILSRRQKTTKHRMQRKWIKDKDRFAMSKTGEKPLHP